MVNRDYVPPTRRNNVTAPVKQYRGAVIDWEAGHSIAVEQPTPLRREGCYAFFMYHLPFEPRASGYYTWLIGNRGGMPRFSLVGERRSGCARA